MEISSYKAKPALHIEEYYGVTFYVYIRCEISFLEIGMNSSGYRQRLYLEKRLRLILPIR